MVAWRWYILWWYNVIALNYVIVVLMIVGVYNEICYIMVPCFIISWWMNSLWCIKLYIIREALLATLLLLCYIETSKNIINNFILTEAKILFWKRYYSLSQHGNNVLKKKLMLILNLSCPKIYENFPKFNIIN